jgi:hypothetical protein
MNTFIQVFSLISLKISGRAAALRTSHPCCGHGNIYIIAKQTNNKNLMLFGKQKGGTHNQ